MRHLIGLSGKKQAGKSTAASIIHPHKFVRLAFADKLKEIVQVLYDFDGDQLWGDRKEEIDVRYGFSARQILQILGVKLREFDEYMWVRPIERRIIENPTTNFVIEDVRFDNESEMIRRHGGQIWEVQRSRLDDTDTHVSEQGLTKPADLNIGNVYGLKEYQQVIETLMKAGL